VTPGKELVLQGGSIVVDQQTGQMLNVAEAEVDDLALYLDGVRELERQLGIAKRHVGEEVLRRMDQDGSWTLRAGPYKLQGRSPAPTVGYDAEALEKALRRLVRSKAISKDAAARALRVEKVIVRTVQKQGVNALLKLGGKVAEAVKACGTEQEASRGIPSVSRSES